MPYCAFCGTQVAPNTPTCPRCGNPPNGVRQPAAVVKGPSSGLPLLLILIVGGFFLVVVLGIIAALLIPNFLDALQKAKQKRTVADLRNVGTAIVSYSVDHNGTLPQGQSLEEIKPVLVPEYLASVPSVDGWKRPFRYSCWRESPGAAGCDHFRIVSGGRDGVLESEDLSKYGQGTFEPTDYDRDIVFGDGFFLQYPAPAGPSGQR
jgi:competence protein ComGC